MKNRELGRWFTHKKVNISFNKRGWYISYIPKAWSANDDAWDETCIGIDNREDNKWMLRGDHRCQLVKLRTLKSALKYYLNSRAKLVYHNSPDEARAIVAGKDSVNPRLGLTN